MSNERSYSEFTPAELQEELRSLFQLIPPHAFAKGEPTEVDISLVTERLGVPEEIADIPEVRGFATLIRRMGSETNAELKRRFVDLIACSQIPGEVRTLLAKSFAHALVWGAGDVGPYNACYRFLRLDSTTNGIFDPEKAKEMASEFINQCGRKGVFEIRTLEDKHTLSLAKQDFRERYGIEP